jgi:hypothetical protein
VPCRVGHGVEGRHGGSQACVRHCTIGDEVREKGRGSTMMVGSTRGVKGGGAGCHVWRRARAMGPGNNGMVAAP